MLAKPQVHYMRIKCNPTVQDNFLSTSPGKDGVDAILVQQGLQRNAHALQLLVVCNVCVVPAAAACSSGPALAHINFGDSYSVLPGKGFAASIGFQPDARIMVTALSLARQVYMMDRHELHIPVCL